MTNADIIVVGGANLDILGVPTQGYIEKDSNVGVVSLRAGGVGRNIAARCAKLVPHVSLITAFGQDENAALLRAACIEAGLDISLSLTLPERSNIYLCIHDDKGDMACAINDMPLNKALSASALAPLIKDINHAGACVMDANLSEDTLRFLLLNTRIPTMIDPVSCHKALTLTPLLPLIDAIKPNLMEAQALTGEKTPEAAARYLLNQGVKRVFISLGAKGVYYADANECGLLAPARIVSAPQTGAGDAMTAGIVAAMRQGAGIRQCAQSGMDAALSHLEAS